MRNTAKVVVASVLLAGTVFPSYAGNLLSSVIGDSDALITLNEGEASDTGVVNLGLGGSNGNIVDLGLGGGEPLASATVETGHSVLDVDVNVGGHLAEATVDVGGRNGLVDADVGLLGGNAQVTDNIGGPSPLPRKPRNPGDPAVGADAAEVANAGDAGVPTGGAGTGVAPCVGESPAQLERLVNSTRLDASLARASNISIQRVSVCPDVGNWLSAELAATGLGSALQNVVAGDALISASLSRSSYGPDRVLAITKAGAQLTVFVY